MSGNVNAGNLGTGARSYCITAGKRLAFPVDSSREVLIGEAADLGSGVTYIVEKGNLEAIRCARPGRHKIKGNGQVIVLESSDRLYISPHDDCILDVGAGWARIRAAGQSSSLATIGVKNKALSTVTTTPDTQALFSCVSAICAWPGEMSPYRSHPFFRADPPAVRLAHSGVPRPSPLARAPIVFHLPADLRYLYAATPLSYYLGAAIDIGDDPRVEVKGAPRELPAEHEPFERWAGTMLSRTFQTDCAVRYAAATGRRLQGIDVRALLGHAPEEVMLMSMPERFRLYMDALVSAGRLFCPWHTASYVDPVPSTVELLPFLLRSLSAVFSPKSSPISERGVVTLSVRSFNERHRGLARGGAGSSEEIVLPSLYNAQVQQWFSRDCPVDASRSSLRALANGQMMRRRSKRPGIGIICNEKAMMKEALWIKELLGEAAIVELREDIGRDDLLHMFSESFDMVHFTGHCERGGLKCRDGFADLSRVGECDVPAFFLNCCSSYTQGEQLIEKGAVCGVATMFRVIDEAAMDVCVNFYRMLAYGYPVLTAFLAARECSVTGKEYLLIGDGSCSIFNGSDQIMPFYKLRRNGTKFTLQCQMANQNKGLIIELADRLAAPDTGLEVGGIWPDDMPRGLGELEGMCLYNGIIYPSLVVAVLTAPTDLECRIPRPGMNKHNILR